MKLAVMKLVCLAILLVGAYAFCLAVGLSQAQQIQARALECWQTHASGVISVRLVAAILGGLAALVGLYGFLPRLPGRRGSVVSFKSSQGDIVIQLKPIRKTLLRMMRKMPEVYSLQLDVRPDKDGRRAQITADVVLTNCAAIGARACARLVTEYMATTARNVLGLEELSAIRVNVRGVRLDVGAAGKQVREQVAARREEVEAETYALAHAPMAAVTLDEASTDNSASVGMEAESETAGTAPVAVACEPVAETAPACEAGVADQVAAQTCDEPACCCAEAVAETSEAVDAVAAETPVASAVEEEEVVAAPVEMASAPPSLEAILPPLTDAVDDDLEMPAAPQIDDRGQMANDESPSSFDKNFGEEPVDEPQAAWAEPVVDAVAEELPVPESIMEGYRHSQEAPPEQQH